MLTGTWSAREAAPASWRRPIAARPKPVEDDRAEHRIAARAAAQSVHHARSIFRVSLFLHAQAVVRASRAGAGGFSRRLRHARRNDGDTDAAANAKTGSHRSRCCSTARNTGRRSSTSTRWCGTARSVPRISNCSALPTIQPRRLACCRRGCGRNLRRSHRRSRIPARLDDKAAEHSGNRRRPGRGRRLPASSYSLVADDDGPLPDSSDSITKSIIFPSGNPTTGIPFTKNVGVDET